MEYKIMLTARQKKLLHWVVQQYIGTATPVGSDQLVRYSGVDCSPATVRNEMIFLEEMGYVRQPHPSAGRVPTDIGYRFYVDSLMKREHVKPDESRRIWEGIGESKGDVKRLLDASSRILSEISEELALVMTPYVSRAVFDRMELIELAKRKILVVIHLRNRRVKTVILPLYLDASESDLQKAAATLNERLSGLALHEIRQSIGGRLNPAHTPDGSVLRTVMENAEDLFDFSSPFEVHTAGTKHILKQPEFSDPFLLERVFSFMEDMEGLKGLLRATPGRIDVVIGAENQDVRLKALSVIMAYYRMGSEDGIIGVIGPTRMRYSKILPLVDHMAQAVTESGS
jgi:heat-inducible transcriptional repressor